MEEAKEMIEQMMPIIEPDVAIWRSFLTACLIHGNIKLAVIAGRKVIELEPSGDDGVYMLLWNAYYAANMWEEAFEVRKLMRANKIRRKRGCSCGWWLWQCDQECDGKMQPVVECDSANNLECQQVQMSADVGPPASQLRHV